ncbi:hypothetical protein ACQR0Y_25180 [Bradyrhizobium oligotrophicum]|nr:MULTISPECIES: hypothetical protein [unclassified Bradyrhizobium]
MNSERHFDGRIDVLLADGARVPAHVAADEIIAGGKETYVQVVGFT